MKVYLGANTVNEEDPEHDRATLADPERDRATQM